MKIVLVTAASIAAGLVLTATPASAACFGTANIGVVCSTVNAKGTLYEDCVYTGGTTCQPVSVPGPAGCITGGGQNWELVPICF